jgi:phage anti-repressor protein
MSIQDPSVRQEFLARVLSVVPLMYRQHINPHILDAFLNIVLKSKRNPFPISLLEIADWMKLKDYRSLERLILPWRKTSKEMLRPEFQEGVDFIVTHTPTTARNQKRTHIWVSVNAFQQLCMMQRNPAALAIRQYFIAVDRLYRDHAERIIYERRQNETQSDTEKMLQIDEDIPDRGEVAYLDKVTQIDPLTHETKVFLHPGHTLDESSRRQNLKSEYGPNQEMIRKKYGKGSSAIEEEFKRLARRWKINCGGSPRKTEAFFTKDIPVQAIWETSVEVQDIADALLLQKLEQSRGHDDILDEIPLSEQSTSSDGFTFHTRNGNLKTVRDGRTETIIPMTMVRNPRHNYQ